ncbi:MAG: DUF4145 domain-containing protein [Candidatus Acidiferrales bacterium]
MSNSARSSSTLVRDDSTATDDLVAAFSDELNVLLGFAKTAKKHGFKLASHAYYADKTKECLICTRRAFLEIRQAYAAVHFPEVAKQLDEIEPLLADVERGISTDDLIRNIDLIQHRMGSDLLVAIHAKAGHNPDGQMFITTEILPAGVYKKVLDEANRCFAQNCPNACAAMLRRLVESLVIEAFEANGIEAKIKDSSGDYLELKALIGKAIAEPVLKLSRNTKNALPNLKFLGDLSVHARRNLVRLTDLTGVRNDARTAIEELAFHLPKA